MSDQDYYMTRENAQKLADFYLDGVIDKRMPHFIDAVIEMVELVQVAPEKFLVYAIAFDKKKHQRIRIFLLNLIEQLNIPIKREDFDLPQKPS